MIYFKTELRHGLRVGHFERVERADTFLGIKRFSKTLPEGMSNILLSRG